MSARCDYCGGYDAGLRSWMSRVTTFSGRLISCPISLCAKCTGPRVPTGDDCVCDPSCANDPERCEECAYCCAEYRQSHPEPDDSEPGRCNE